MAFVDATIVNVAIPSIGRAFPGEGLSNVSWVLNAYNVVFAAFLVGGGQLADLLGRRRIFVAALVVFTVASALCAVSSSLVMLVVARIVQAAGAAMLVPSSLALVLQAFEERERTHAVALWSAVAALAAGIGPPLGGLLITASSWRLVFLVNIPVGVVGVVLAQRVIVESRAPGRRRMPDLAGAVLLATGIASFVLAVVQGPEWGWSSAGVVSAFAASVALAAAFGIRSSRHRNPLIDLLLLRTRSFAVANGATIVMAAGFYAYTLCNVLFLTTVWRYSILSAGLALTPGPFTAIAVAAPSSRLAERYGARAVAVPGALVWAGGTVYFASVLGVQPHFLGEWLPGMIILGIGAGLTFPTLSGAAVESVPGPRFAMASALNSVARQIGAAVGVATLVAILHNPRPLEALKAFDRGWFFAAGCFLAGGAGCLALARRRATATDASDAVGIATPLAVAIDEEPTADGLVHLSVAPEERALPEPQTPAQFLRLVPVFSKLPERVLGELAAVSTDVKLARGEWLFKQGDEPDAIYVLRIGQLAVVRQLADSEPETVNELTRGAVLGELALLSETGRRGASVRAVRDSELIAIERDRFETLLGSEPELALGLMRSLGAQLGASRAIPIVQRPRPVTIALVATDETPLLDLADELSRVLCAWGRVAVLFPKNDGDPRANGAGGVASFAPVVESCEREHDHVLMLCGGGEMTQWDEFCLGRADRVLVVATGPLSEEAGLRLRGLVDADLLGFGIERGSGALQGWLDLLAPSSVFTIPAEGPERIRGVRRTARRLCGRALGVVLSGGGARAFSHLGVLEVLLDAGLAVDRVAGVSMGSFIGAMLADGYDGAAIDACCYEEWVRRNPINDYTVPRHSLIRGGKAEAMLERVFGDVNVEELERTFYCASVDLRGNRLVLHRDGPLLEAVGASMSLPLIAPPVRRKGGLLIDGSLLDNLPLAPMRTANEGPVLAIDVKADNERPRTPMPAGQPTARLARLPTLPETMARIALLSSANTEEAARRHADLTISVRVPGVGLLEFHQIDAAREAGRRAAEAALEQPPEWLINGAAPIASLAGRRTVVPI
jgi:EmrB/QacA subfamily drug resistance transporter